MDTAKWRFFPNEFSFKSMNWLTSSSKLTVLVGSLLTLLQRLLEGQCSHWGSTGGFDFYGLYWMGFHVVWLFVAKVLRGMEGHWHWHCLAPSFYFFMSSIKWKSCERFCWEQVNLFLLVLDETIPVGDLWGINQCRDAWYLARLIYILVLLLAYSEGILSTIVQL